MALEHPCDQAAGPIAEWSGRGQQDQVDTVVK
jgi:hypothetical protein